MDANAQIYYLGYTYNSMGQMWSYCVCLNSPTYPTMVKWSDIVTTWYRKQKMSHVHLTGHCSNGDTTSQNPIDLDRPAATIPLIYWSPTTWGEPMQRAGHSVPAWYSTELRLCYSTTSRILYRRSLYATISFDAKGLNIHNRISGMGMGKCADWCHLLHMGWLLNSITQFTLDLWGKIYSNCLRDHQWLQL